MYAQRTADDRIAFGGRGVPYRFGSRVDSDGRTQERTIAALTALLRDFFPAASDVPIAHAWAGVLGVPRDWAAPSGVDAATGLGWAGGYVGTGVTATNLAGRTLADLVLAPRHRAHAAALGRAPRTAVGDRAAALARACRASTPPTVAPRRSVARRGLAGRHLIALIARRALAAGFRAT